MALPWRPSAFGKRSCQNRAQRDSAATPRDPCADPLCRENSLRGADWRTERENYGAAAQRKPRVCPKCAANVAQTWRFCSVVYTTARTFPRGAGWRVARPRHREKAFSSSWRRQPGGAAGAPQPVEDLGGFAALAPVAFWGDFGRRGARVGFLRRGGHVVRLGPGRRNVRPVCGDVRLLGGGWLLGRGTGPGVRRFCRQPLRLGRPIGEGTAMEANAACRGGQRVATG